MVVTGWKWWEVGSGRVAVVMYVNGGDGLGWVIGSLGEDLAIGRGGWYGGLDRQVVECSMSSLSEMGNRKSTGLECFSS